MAGKKVTFGMFFKKLKPLVSGKVKKIEGELKKTDLPASERVQKNFIIASLEGGG